MRALHQSQADEGYSWAELTSCDLSQQPLKPTEVLIRVSAVGLNRADLAQMAGFYPAPAGEPEWIGLECSGTVAAVGDQVSRWSISDQVIALVAGGACADYVICDEKVLATVPQGVDLVSAAGLVEIYATAWLNLMMKAKMKRSDRLLVHAGASGVGTAAIQIGRFFAQEVVVTASSESKQQFCLEQGASATFSRGDSWLEQLKQRYADGVDVVLDCVGGSYFDANTQALRLGGRLVIIGLLGGSKAEIDLARLLMLRQQVIGSTLRSLPIDIKQRILFELSERIWPLIESGDIVPAVDSVYEIADWHSAVTHMQTDSNMGKIILQLDKKLDD